jgi:hypothetical protein
MNQMGDEARLVRPTTRLYLPDGGLTNAWDITKAIEALKNEQFKGRTPRICCW